MISSIKYPSCISVTMDPELSNDGTFDPKDPLVLQDTVRLPFALPFVLFQKTLHY